MFLLRFLMCLASLSVAVWPSMATGNHAATAPAPVFLSIIFDLKSTMNFRAPYVPICLPAALPAHKTKLYPQVTYDWKGHTFLIELFSDTKYRDEASKPYWFAEQWNGPGGAPRPGDGPTLAIDNTFRPVSIRPGTWGFVDPNLGANGGSHISWWQRQVLFSFGRRLPDKILAAVAGSLTCIK